MTDRREQLRVNDGLSVPIEDIGVRYETSGGAGGQHANRSHTRVELELDVRTCGGLSEAQRERIVARIGPIVRAGSADSRSQLRNREVALERLAAKLGAALHVDPPRRPTRPTRGSVTRRLNAKKQTGERKALRRRPTHDD